MNAKRVIGITLTGIVLLLLAAGVRMAQSPDVSLPKRRAARRRSPPPRRRWSHRRAPPRSSPRTHPRRRSTGAVVTQVFTLHAGWNAIYLGVEPINESPGDGVPTLSVMEWVFKDLAASGALESVWTYNRPVSQKDYIIDPGEGLWDAPGWERYVPAEMTRRRRAIPGLPEQPLHAARQHRLPGEAQGRNQWNHSGQGQAGCQPSLAGRWMRITLPVSPCHSRAGSLWARSRLLRPSRTSVA